MLKNIETMAMCLSDLFPISVLPESLHDMQITGLSLDSRSVALGYAFVAVTGGSVNGEHFIPQAVSNGAAVIFKASSDQQYRVSEYMAEDGRALPVIAIPSLLEVLSKIAGIFYKRPSQQLNVVGITGTNGKTTCSQLYAQLLSLLGQPAGVIGTMGYGLYSPQQESMLPVVELQDVGMTTPDAITTQKIFYQLLMAGAENIAIEASSHGLAQHRLSAVDINTAVWTNLTHDHLDYHGDMDSYGAAKAILFTMQSLKSAVINIDDAYAQQLLSVVDSRVQVVTYSLFDSSADLYLSNVVYQASGISACLHTPQGALDVVTRLAGSFNLSNLLAVLATFYVADIEFSTVVSKVSELAPVAGRMELIANQLGKQVIVDYAHTPDALKNALLAVKDHAHKNIWCVFGCGGDRDKAKRPLMAAIAEQYASHVVVTSDNPRGESVDAILNDVVSGFTQQDHHIIADRQQAIEFAIKHSTVGDVILIAGKGHEDYQLIKGNKLPFSDQAVARLAMRQQEEGQSYD